MATSPYSGVNFQDGYPLERALKVLQKNAADPMASVQAMLADKASYGIAKEPTAVAPPVTWADYSSKSDTYTKSAQGMKADFDRWNSDVLQPYAAKAVPVAQRDKWIADVQQAAAPSLRAMPTRSALEAAKDADIYFSASAANTVKSLADIGSVDNVLSRALEGYAKDQTAGLSDYALNENLLQAEARARIADDDYMGRAKLAASNILTSPLKSLFEIGGNIVPMMVGGAAGLGVKGIVALSAAMGGGAVKGGIAENINNATEAQLMSDPIYAAARQSGMSQEDSKSALKQQRASYEDAYGKIGIGGLIGAAVGRLGSVEQAIAGVGRGTGGSLAKEVAKGALKEPLTEIPQEVSENYLANLGAGSGGANIDPYQNLIEAGVQAGLMSVAPGAIAGGFSASPRAQTPQPVIPPTNQTNVPQGTAPQQPNAATSVNVQQASVTPEAAAQRQKEADFESDLTAYATLGEEQRSRAVQLATDVQDGLINIEDVNNEIKSVIKAARDATNAATGGQAGASNQTVPAAKSNSANTASNANSAAAGAIQGNGNIATASNAEAVSENDGATLQGQTIGSTQPAGQQPERNGAGNAANRQPTQATGDVVYGTYNPADTGSAPSTEAPTRLLNTLVAQANGKPLTIKAATKLAIEHEQGYTQWVDSNGVKDSARKSAFDFVEGVVDNILATAVQQGVPINPAARSRGAKRLSEEITAVTRQELGDRRAADGALMTEDAFQKSFRKSANASPANNPNPSQPAAVSPAIPSGVSIPNTNVQPNAAKLKAEKDAEKAKENAEIAHDKRMKELDAEIEKQADRQSNNVIAAIEAALKLPLDSMPSFRSSVLRIKELPIEMQEKILFGKSQEPIAPKLEMPNSGDGTTVPAAVPAQAKADVAQSQSKISVAQRISFDAWRQEMSDMLSDKNTDDSDVASELSKLQYRLSAQHGAKTVDSAISIMKLAFENFGVLNSNAMYDASLSKQASKTAASIAARAYSAMTGGYTTSGNATTAKNTKRFALVMSQWENTLPPANNSIQQAKGKEISRDIGQFKQGRSEANAKQTARDLAKKNPDIDYTVEEDATLKNGFVVVGREKSKITLSKTQDISIPEFEGVMAKYLAEQVKSRVKSLTPKIRAVGFSIKDGKDSNDNITLIQTNRDLEKIFKELSYPNIRVSKERSREIYKLLERFDSVLNLNPEVIRRNKEAAEKTIKRNQRNLFKEKDSPVLENEPQIDSLQYFGVREIDLGQPQNLDAYLQRRFDAVKSNNKTVWGGDHTVTRLLKDTQTEFTGFVKELMASGMPTSLVAKTPAYAVAVMPNDMGGYVVRETQQMAIGEQYFSSDANHRKYIIAHEHGHVLDKDAVYSNADEWHEAQMQLKKWNAAQKDTNTYAKWLNYPFDRKDHSPSFYSEEAFAQAFAIYFINNAELLANAPAAHEAIKTALAQERINGNTGTSKSSNTGNGGQSAVQNQRRGEADSGKIGSGLAGANGAARDNAIPADISQRTTATPDDARADRQRGRKDQGLSNPQFSQSPATTNPNNHTAIRTSIEGILGGMKDAWARISQHTVLLTEQDLPALLKAKPWLKAVQNSITAYHGSPYRFSEFSLDHLGKGEGAQAYGWGLYFSGNKDVAEYYKQALSGAQKIATFTNGKIRVVDTKKIYARLVKKYGEEIAEDFSETIRMLGTKEIDIAGVKRMHFGVSNEYSRDVYMVFRDAFEVKGDGQTYRVNIKPDEDTFLLWDKPLSEQPKKVRDALASEFLDSYLNDFNDKPAKDFYKAIAGGENIEDFRKEASQQLSKLGINGIKYLDGTSRDSGKGSYNYVVFDDKAIEIVEAYYSRGDDAKVQAFYDPTDKKIYLITDRIEKGQEDGVWLHEVFHKRGEELLGAESLKKLHDNVQGWKTRKPDSVERQIYEAAHKRATDSGKYDTEFLTYAIEEATNRGVTPDASKGTMSAAGWLAKVKSLFEGALRKLLGGLAGNIDISANDLMAMAYGAAKLEYEGKTAGAQGDGVVARSNAPVKSKIQTDADALNSTMAKYFNDATWSNAYEQVNLPNSLSEYAAAASAAFDARIVAIRPTAAKFNQFNGINVAGRNYINTDADISFINITGHELYHDIEKNRPDLHAWLKGKAQAYYKDFDAYKDKLNALVGKGENPYTRDSAKSELLADFMGDAMVDPQFLAGLAKANPSKFSELLKHAVAWLKDVANKLNKKDLGSSKYFTDVEAMRQYLGSVLQAHATGNTIADIDAPSFSRNSIATSLTPFDGIEAARTPLGDAKTVTVDGKEYSVFNSDGKPIHGTVEGVRNFVRWFGDDGVKNDAGRPIVLYRSGKENLIESNKKTTWFTTSKDVAKTYGESLQEFYVKLGNNSDYVNAMGSKWDNINYYGDSISSDAIAEISKDAGVIGLKIENVIDSANEQFTISSDVYVTFGGLSQFKSATGNNGDFNPENPGIRFSRRTQADAVSEAANIRQFKPKPLAPTNWQQDLIRVAADSLIVVRDFVNELPISELGRQMLSGDLYRQATVRASLEKKAQDDYINPMGKEIRKFAEKHKLTLEQANHTLDEWARANYAAEGNAVLLKNANAELAKATDPAEIADINSRIADIQSGKRGVGGLSDASAASIKADLEAQFGEADIRKMYAPLRGLLDWKLQVDVQSGRVDQATADKLQADSPNYVPTTGDPRAEAEHSQEFISGGGLNQSKDKTRAGRTTLSDAPTEAAIEAVIKSTALAGWSDFKTNINDVYESAAEQFKAQGHPVADAQKLAALELGFTRTRQTALTRTGDNVLIHRVKGNDYAFTFDDERIVPAIRREGVEDTPALLKPLAVPLSWFSRAVTQFMYGFAPINAVRDIWEKSELVRTRKFYDSKGNLIDSKKLARAAIAYSVSPSTMAATMGKGWNRGDATTVERKLLDKMIADGGLSTWGQLFDRNMDAAKKEWLKQGRMDKEVFSAVSKFTEGYNNQFELISGFSVYRAMLDAGMTEKDAAASTLDLMNFKKRGEWSAMPRALYAFANPVMQGSLNLTQALKTRTGQVRLAGYMTAFLVIAAALREIDDEDPTGKKKSDSLGDWVTERSIPIPIGSGKYFKVPVGFGLPQFALGIAGNLFKWGTGEATALDTVGELAKVGIKTYSPTGMSNIKLSKEPMAYFLQAFSPTLAKGVVQVGTDVNNFGGKISPFFNNPNKLHSDQGKVGTPDIYKDTAKFMQRTFGMDTYPERIKTISDSLLVGPMRYLLTSVQNDTNAKLGREERPNALSPFVAKYSEIAPVIAAREAADELKQVRLEQESRVKTGEPPLVFDLNMRKKMAAFEDFEKTMNSERGQGAAATRRFNEGGMTEVMRNNIRVQQGKDQLAASVRFVTAIRRIDGKNVPNAKNTR